MINSSHIYEKQSLFFVFLFLQGLVVDIPVGSIIFDRLELIDNFGKPGRYFVKLLKK